MLRWIFAAMSIAAVGCEGSVSTREPDGGTDASRSDAAAPSDASDDAPPVDGAPADATVEEDAAGEGGGAPVDLCAWPSASLIDGRFEDALVDGVPGGWQVRDPASRAACGDEHVSLADGPAGCGTSLVIDAMGSWDCWAIQRFTDYGTITGGRRYRISAVVRSEGQDSPAAWFLVGLQWLDGSDRVFGDEKNPPLGELNFDYTLLSWELVAPADARRAVVWLSAHYPGRVTYDQVAIVPID